MAKGQKKARKIQEEIDGLKTVRKKSLIVVLLAIVVIVVMAFVRQSLVVQGVISADDTSSTMIIFVVSLGLCFLVAPYSNAIIRVNRRIRELKDQLELIPTE